MSSSSIETDSENSNHMKTIDSKNNGPIGAINSSNENFYKTFTKTKS